VHIEEGLYRKIVRVMPIPCVDLLVTDRTGRVLLVKRKNEPAKGQWWFPGGRVHHGETRAVAAKRKLWEECGLVPESVAEMGTYDLILPVPPPQEASHAITTLFLVRVSKTTIGVDEQSAAADWRTFGDWKGDHLHPFVAEGLTLGQEKVSV